MSKPDWQRTAIEQLEANSRVANTARGPVEYAEIGDPARTAVLSVHGRPGGYDQGLVIARSLGEQLARWIAVSRPGYLRTPIETGRTPHEQADAFQALLDSLGIRQAVVVALSAGGPSSLQFALRHADRCRGLVLVSALSRRKRASERTPGQKVYDATIAPSDRLAWLFYRVCATFAGPTARQALGSVLVLSESLRGAGRRNDLIQNEALPPEPPSGIRVPALSHSWHRRPGRADRARRGCAPGHSRRQVRANYRGRPRHLRDAHGRDQTSVRGIPREPSVRWLVGRWDRLDSRTAAALRIRAVIQAW